MENILQKIHYWLGFIKKYPLVPGFIWTDKIKAEWMNKLNQKGIQLCFDDLGHVLIGCETSHDWYDSVYINHNKETVFYETQLMHHGGVVLSQVGKEKNGWRYSALMRGFFNKLTGLRFNVVSPLGKNKGFIVIDYKREQEKEKFVSFVSENQLNKGDFLLPPDVNVQNQQENKSSVFCGWGVSHHMGAAMILAFMEWHQDQKILARLLMGAGSDDKNKKIVIPQVSFNVMPENKAENFMMGQGCVTHKITKTQWVLQIPCLYYHNALPIKEWRAEELIENDVLSAMSALKDCVNKIKKENKDNNVGEETEADSVCQKEFVKIHDHVKDICQNMTPETSYTDCVKNVLPVWNEIHEKFKIETVKFSSQNWPVYRSQILQSIKVSEYYKKKAFCVVKNLYDYFGINELEKKCINIHFVSCASQAVTVVDEQVVVSIDKEPQELVLENLCAKIIQLLVGPVIKSKNERKLINRILETGVGLRVKDDLFCGCSQESQINHFTPVRQLYEGDVFDIKTGRHVVVSDKDSSQSELENYYQRCGKKIIKRLFGTTEKITLKKITALTTKQIHIAFEQEMRG